MQNDLISRSALIAHIGDLGNDPEDDTTFLTVGQACAIAHKSIVDMVKAAPAVDAVALEILEGKMLKAVMQKQDGTVVEFLPVVRCKDCRFYEKGVEYYGGGTKDICRLLKRQMQDDDYCSYGERRGNDGK